MKLSSKARYGLKACLVLAEGYKKEQPLALPAFSEKAGVSESYMEQIMILLKKAQLVESVRGASGGYYLSKPPKNVSVGEVLRALEDGLEIAECINTPCEGAEDCKARSVFNTIYNDMNATLDNISLDYLVKDGDKIRYIYLDHAATTNVDDEVLAQMLPYFVEKYGNANSQHGLGRETAFAVDKGRRQVATAINAKQNEIYFTSGGSESDNWAIRGIAMANKDKGRHIISSNVEHPAVTNTLKSLEREGFEVTYLKVNSDGIVEVSDLVNAIRPDTILVSIMFANNEIGTIQPIDELVKVAHSKGIIFHTDAVQAVGTLDIDVKALDVDLLSMSAHKFYGPKGIGALYIRNGLHISRLINGGEQERSQRAGTTNTPAIVGMGFALEKAVANREKNNQHIKDLRDHFVKRVIDEIQFVRYNGHPEKRLPSNANFSFEYIEGESILFTLDMSGICASSGSACSAGSLEPSSTIMALGVQEDMVHGSIRFSFGKENTLSDVDFTVDRLKETVERLRSMSPLFKQNKEEIFYV
ncbi:MAG: cysteine desulfurase NifS [Clostridia bacterium]